MSYAIFFYIACLFRCCCCFYYLFCCCICCEKSKAVTKQTFVKRFEKWLNLDKRLRKERSLLVAKTMMRMYAHQPGAIKDLEKCRVNPDFKSMFRDDLEFYIPQLCSFFLKGNLENTRDEEDLFKVIILASETNFFFSHRIWFFFHSAMFKEFNQKIYGQSQ